MSTLRLIFGDQLHANHSWFIEKSDDVTYLIAELHQEQSYVQHHVQKITAFFIAMQRFAKALQSAGHQVIHLTLDETAGFESLDSLINGLVEQHGFSQVEYQRPDEIRLLEQCRNLSLPEGTGLREYDSEHFFLPFEAIRKEFKPNTGHRMEAFYRRMRVKHGYLMQGQEPEGGRWNYDTENQKAFKKEDLFDIPEPLVFAHDTQEIRARLDRHSINYFGEMGEQLIWPTTRSEALELLAFFCRHCLPLFGRFQDAMTTKSEHKWSLYHSRISFALNCKMISPAQVIERAIKAYREQPDRIDIAQIEGFVRQILGWREFVRGIYWINLPEYPSMNALKAERNLPSFFWDGKTKMHCMQQCINQSLEYAYAHHIQRLMVIGNFCLMAGIDPKQVDAWYLGIYIDAIEWVEMPNTRGMSQFADGGLLASKPYSGSGQYVNRMSDYCKGCHYDVKKRSGNHSCPFNSLYWHFQNRHASRFSNNPRTAMVYRNWNKKSEEEKAHILQTAERYLQDLSQL